MNYKYVGKELLLDFLSGVPIFSVLARQIDSIASEKRFREIGEEIHHLENLIKMAHGVPNEGIISEALTLIEKVGSVKDFNFRKMKGCLAVMREINIRSKMGYANDPLIEYEECLKILKGQGNSKDLNKEFELVAYELEKEDLIYKHPSVSSPIGFHAISPQDYFFCRTDNIFQKWHPSEDADVVIDHMIKTKEENISLLELDKLLGWGPRRLNSAIAWLDYNGLIKKDYDFGSGISTGYVLWWIRLSEEAYLRS